MSGNPFRRKPQPEPVAEWYSGDSTSIDRISPPPDTERRSSKAKRVRIQTPPPLSPDSVHEEEESTISRVADETHEGSPPPDPSRIAKTAVVPEITQDPFGKSDSEEDASASEELLDNTKMNSATGSASTVEVPIIKNPFQKTLATMGPGAAPPVPAPSASQDDTSTPSSQTSRAGMDVDSFKRLLMTGAKDTGQAEPSPAASTATTTTTSSYFTGDSSSTDTSSISKHSMTEAPTALSDLEEESSASDVDEASTQTSDKPSKPLPPNHRHGRSIGASRTPETVPFASFTPNLDTTPAPSKINPKPVPPPPPRHRTSTKEKEAPDRRDSKNIDKSTTRQEGATPTKVLVSGNTSSDLDPPPLTRPSRVPPPPPSRRPGSGKTSLSEASPDPSSPSSDRPEPPLITDTPSRSSSVSSNRRPMVPPPPPPRRRRNSSKSSLDQVTSSSSQYASVDERRSSMTSVDRVTEDSQSTNPYGGTVLKDMDDLQAEIDALQAQSGKKP